MAYILILDRYEGEIAVIEAGEEMIKFGAGFLPDRAREGDVLKIVVDEEKTEQRKNSIKEISQEVFK